MIGMVREQPAGFKPTASTDASMPPVDLLSPHYYVQVREKDGTWVNITDRVEDLIHTDKGGGGSTSLIEIPVNNFDDWALRHGTLMRKGARFKATYGYPGRMREPGEFIAKEHKGNSKTITITAYERKRSKRSRRPASRVWLDKTRSEVVREVLSGKGTDDSTLHITETGQRFPSITQAKETEWQLASRLARLEGFELWADEGGVYWQEPPRENPPSHMFRHVRNFVGVGAIKDYSVDSFGAGVPGRVVLYGRDPRSKRAYKVEGSKTATRGLVQMVDSDDIKTPDEGDQVDEGDSGFEISTNIGSRTEAEAQLLADSIYKEYYYNALKLDLTVFLDPTIRVFSNTLVWGLGPAFDGVYSVRNAVHRCGSKESTLQLRRSGKKKSGSGGSSADTDLEEMLKKFLKTKSGINIMTKVRNPFG